MKKRMVVVILVLLAMALTAMTASAAVTKYVTVKIYKHPSVKATEFSDSMLKSYTSTGMSRIKDAVYYGSISDTDGHVVLQYTIQGPYAKSDWTTPTCNAIYPKSPQDYAIYFVQGIMAQVGFAYGTGEYAVIDLAPYQSGCSNVFDTTKYVAVIHEFGHVYNVVSNHDNTVGKCVMDKVDAKAGYTYFCDVCKGKIHAYVESRPQNLN